MIPTYATSPVKNAEIERVAPEKDGFEMPDQRKKTRKGLMFAAGECVGTAVAATTAILPKSDSGAGKSERVRKGLFRALLELRIVNMEKQSEADKNDKIDNVLSWAQETAHLILEGPGQEVRRTVDADFVIDIIEADRDGTNERTVKKLQCSIEKFGLKNPLVVREVNGTFQLASGYARYEACRRLKLSKIPVLVKKLDRKEATELALLDMLMVSERSRVGLDAWRPLFDFYAGDDL